MIEYAICSSFSWSWQHGECLCPRVNGNFITNDIKKTIMQSKECTNIRARPSRATHIPLPSLCVTHLFFISISVIKWLRISYAQFTVRQVRKSEDIETWIPACTVLPKAKIIAKICNLINLIIGVDYKAFWKFSYWSDNFSVFFLNREYCHNSSAKRNTLSYIPFISNHMFGINWYFLQYAHSSIELVNCNQKLIVWVNISFR